MKFIPSLERGLLPVGSWMPVICLKATLELWGIRCIGSTTFSEFRGIFEKDSALARRFQKIDVLEPDVENTYLILKGLKPQFEQHHELKYTDKALRAAAELADRYITDRHMPDKAIDVIDEAGASQRLIPVAKRKKVIGVSTIEQIVAAIARIPPKMFRCRTKIYLEILSET